MANLSMQNSNTVTYSYKAEAKVVIEEETYEIHDYNIRSVIIDFDYERNNMPMIFVTASIDKTVIDLMVKHQDNSNVIFTLKKSQSNSGSGVFQDYINDKFVYFIPDDTTKTEEYDYKDNNQGRDDMFKIVTFGLICLDHINNNKKALNGVLKGKMSSILYYLTGHLKIVMEPPTENVELKEVYLPPTNSVGKSLKYLNNVHTIYDTPYRYFIDFDCSYLISSSGKAIPKKGEKINTIMLTLKNTRDPASKIQGMSIDKAQGMYKIDIDGIDCDLSDKYTSDKSYAKVSAATTSGSLEKTELTNSGDLIEKRTRTIRLCNDNKGLLTNMQKSLDLNAIQLLVQKTDIDAEPLTMNKEYIVQADDVYHTDKYNGKYIVSRRRDLYIREDYEFVMSTSLVLKKVPEEKK